MNTLAPTALTARSATALAELATAAPGLLPAFHDALPRAADVVTRRLAGALLREGLLREGPGGAPSTVVIGRHGFGRTEVALTGAASRVLAELCGRLDSSPLADELADAVVHLALAYARRTATDAVLLDRAAAAGASDTLDLAAQLPADEQALFFERLASEGHNLHPCGRTRLGWNATDALAHDLEAGTTAVGFVAVRRELHIGDDVGTALGIAAPPGYLAQPVHAWQLAQVLRRRYADLFTTGALLPLDGIRLAAAPTAALRTLLLGCGPGGERRYLKLSLDIQVTSTRRTISVASTRNGPALSALLARLVAEDPTGGRILLLAEVAGAALVAGAAGLGGAAGRTAAGADRSRDGGAILRRGIEEAAGGLVPGEIAVPAGALYATSPVTGRPILTELLARYAATRGLADAAPAALAFLDEYSRLFLPPLLRLLTRHGIAMEAHLQNCIPTFVAGVPHRLALRDFAGLRVYLPRLAARGVRLTLWPGSVVGTPDLDVARAKLAYTALQAHLGELVLQLVGSHGLDEAAAWRQVRTIVDEVHAELRADPATAADAAADHAFWTAPTLPHKALVRMRLGSGAGDVYVPVPNPLWFPT